MICVAYLFDTQLKHSSQVIIPKVMEHVQNAKQEAARTSFAPGPNPESSC
jgi:hypothetical protein